ncbi:MAG: PD-(D/E)XK nuclease family protein, partial [Frankiaceae bacterium]|jgi:RecB family exonuclease|nr:PD-(D/E)XK nuclease family protein [Frankiaceae bacterium]
VGVLIHDIAAAEPGAVDAAQLARLLDERFASLDIAAPWYRDIVRGQATQMLGRYARWAGGRRSRTQLVAVERSFAVSIEGEALLAGRVDRLERGPDGRLLVIDLKTGATAPRKQDMPRHPQLGAYQLAIECGGFGAGESSGGAALVQLGRGASAGYQPQQPLSEDEEPDWARRLVLDLAARYRGARFAAMANEGCERCDLARCCPISPAGRPVTS